MLYLQHAYDRLHKAEMCLRGNFLCYSNGNQFWIHLHIVATTVFPVCICILTSSLYIELIHCKVYSYSGFHSCHGETAPIDSNYRAIYELTCSPEHYWCQNEV